MIYKVSNVESRKDFKRFIQTHNLPLHLENNIFTLKDGEVLTIDHRIRIHEKINKMNRYYTVITKNVNDVNDLAVTEMKVFLYKLTNDELDGVSNANKFTIKCGDDNYMITASEIEDTESIKGRELIDLSNRIHPFLNESGLILRFDPLDRTIVEKKVDNEWVTYKKYRLGPDNWECRLMDGDSNEWNQLEFTNDEFNRINISSQLNEVRKEFSKVSGNEVVKKDVIPEDKHIINGRHLLRYIKDINYTGTLKSLNNEQYRFINGNIEPKESESNFEATYPTLEKLKAAFGGQSIFVYEEKANDCNNKELEITDNLQDVVNKFFHSPLQTIRQRIIKDGTECSEHLVKNLFSRWFSEHYGVSDDVYNEFHHDFLNDIDNRELADDGQVGFDDYLHQLVEKVSDLKQINPNYIYTKLEHTNITRNERISSYIPSTSTIYNLTIKVVNVAARVLLVVAAVLAAAYLIGGLPPMVAITAISASISGAVAQLLISKDEKTGKTGLQVIIEKIFLTHVTTNVQKTASGTVDWVGAGWSS